MFYTGFHDAVSRRMALGGVAAAGAALAMPAVALGKGAASRPLDVLDPRDNLYGFAKMWGTIGPKATLSGYQGIQYAIVGSERASRCSAIVASATSAI